MNRIYQSKITNVEIANPDKLAPPICHSPQAHTQR
jgi:hypothetical protein